MILDLGRPCEPRHGGRLKDKLFNTLEDTLSRKGDFLHEAFSALYRGIMLSLPRGQVNAGCRA